jgi:transcriptional regulator with XRE-family HTH domain
LTGTIFHDRVSYVIRSEEETTVAKIVSKAFQLRKQLELKEGRRVPLVEVAEKAGVERKALARLEAGETERYDGDFIARLCKFYGVGVAEILEYDPSDIKIPSLAAA